MYLHSNESNLNFLSFYLPFPFSIKIVDHFNDYIVLMKTFSEPFGIQPQFVHRRVLSLCSNKEPHYTSPREDRKTIAKKYIDDLGKNLQNHGASFNHSCRKTT